MSMRTQRDIQNLEAHIEDLTSHLDLLRAVPTYMRSQQNTRNLEARIEELTTQLDLLRADLCDLQAQQDDRPHQFDQNGDEIYIGDTVYFRPPEVNPKSFHRIRGVIVRFTAARVYVRRATDLRNPPQLILRDPAKTRLIAE